MELWNTVRSTDLLSDSNLDTNRSHYQSHNGLTTAIQPTLGSSAANLASSTSAGGDWFSQNFLDPGVTNVVRAEYDRDGSLNRNDVITVFGEIVGSGNVTGAEFQDCQTLVQDWAVLGMPNYVAVLASKVVYPDIANTLYQGASLGNLQVGSTPNQLALLVNKWFYGTDLPYAETPALNGHGAFNINYQWASGSLFGTKNAPSITDIQQGDLGDCYFLSALATTVSHDPAAIQNMFTDNGDGTYTVRLFTEQNGTAGSADYVTVNRYLPASVSDSSTTVPQRFANYNSTTGIWVALAEKAYAQLAEEQVSQRPIASNGYTYNSYTSIEAGAVFEALPAITGRSAGFYANGNFGAGQWGSIPTLSQIAQDIANGWFMSVGTIGQSDSESDPTTGLVYNHAYTIYSVDPSTGQLWLYNPWGDNQAATGDYNGFKLISYNSLLTDTSEIDIG